MEQKLNGTEVVGEIMVLFKTTFSSVTLKHHRIPHYMDHFLSYLNMEIRFILNKSNQALLHACALLLLCYSPFYISQCILSDWYLAKSLMLVYNFRCLYV